MTFVEDVQRARSPREAMLNLAAGLDVLAERMDKLESTTAWDEWPDDPNLPTVPPGPGDSWDYQLPAPTRHAPSVIVNGDTTTIDIPPPSPEKLAARRLFEQQALHLSEYLGTSEDWTEVYAKGGPTWLYDNRELVMSLPKTIRQALVDDLEQDAPQQAKEMARDILKASAEETGYGNAPALADEFEGGVK